MNCIEVIICFRLFVAGVLTVIWKAMFAMWKRELTRGSSCPEFICAETLMEAGGFDVCKCQFHLLVILCNRTSLSERLGHVI